MQKMIKEKRGITMKEKGITLVALIVTIIILLILVGVTISLVVGNQGIIGRTKDATSKYTQRQSEEQVALLMQEYTIENIEKGTTLEDFLKGKKEDGTITDYKINDDKTADITKDGYVVNVSENGVTSSTKLADSNVDNHDDTKNQDETENGKVVQLDEADIAKKITEPSHINAYITTYNKDQSGLFKLSYNYQISVYTNGTWSDWIDEDFPGPGSDSGEQEKYEINITQEMINNAGGAFIVGLKGKANDNGSEKTLSESKSDGQVFTYGIDVTSLS